MAPEARRVVVCDSDRQSVRALRFVLRGAGFGVDATYTAAEALDRVAVRPPDAAIVELVLGDVDGIAVCRRLREWSAMPVIVLSTESKEELMVRALEAGADDYVTKPFGPDELVARLRAVLRRAEPKGDQPRIEASGLEVDLAARVVLREGREVHLTPIEYQLLRVLTLERGRLITHDELLRRVWGAVHLSDRQTLRAHIANLRRKVDPGGQLGLIRSFNGSGYRFEDPSSRRSPAALARPRVPYLRAA
jgi:two-component system, OmpR family, KDP operon response regulator KdpE